jgi:hypothetical protein
MNKAALGWRIAAVMLAVSLSAASTTGCAAVGLTLFGIGAGVSTGNAVSYTLNGFAYKTFTAPLPKVERATLIAFNRMGIAVKSKEKTDQGKFIKADTPDRQIEVELEAISPKATRIRTVAKQGFFFKDRATATEIIQQTGKVLGPR